MRVWLPVLACGCGRIGFEASGPDAAGMADTGTAPFACPPGPAPDPITISGSTFEYTSFANSTAAVGNVMVSVIASFGVPPGGQTTSDVAGAYTMSFSSTSVYLIEYSQPSYQATFVFLDRPLDRNLAGSGQPFWSPGDGPIWTSGAVNTVYSSTGATPDFSRGTINIAVRDCAGAPLTGVSVSIDPPPALLTYTDASGVPDASLTATTGPFAHAVGLNAPVASTHVTASAPGLRFTEITFNASQQATSLAIIHGGP